MDSNNTGPSGTRAKKSRMLKAIGTMSNQLLEKCNSIKELLAKATRLDAQHRYKAAQLIKEVWDAGPTYGQNAMAQLAAALGWSTSTAYRYKDVAETFAPDEFERLLQQSNEYGRPLSWQHFLELSKVENEEQRQRLLAFVLNDGLSARHLGKMIGKSRPKKCKTRAKQMSGQVCEDIEELALESEAFAEKVQLSTVRLAEQLDRITSRAASPDLRKEIIAARNGLLKASRACQKGIERLDGCLRSDDDHGEGDVLQFSVPFVSAPAMPASAGA